MGFSWLDPEEQPMFSPGKNGRVLKSKKSLTISNGGKILTKNRGEGLTRGKGRKENTGGVNSFQQKGKMLSR